MVQTGADRLEPKTYQRREIGPEEAWLRVEACGICGTDVEAFHGHLTELMHLDFAFIPGHEPLGFIEEIGEIAAARWGVGVGDRVAVEPMLRCGHCRYCITGQYTQCNGWDGRNLAYGFVNVERSPQLWGGYAEYLYLHPNTVLHRLPANLPTGVASLWNALGGGVRWAGADAGTRSGDSVVIFGPGPRGLCSGGGHPHRLSRRAPGGPSAPSRRRAALRRARDLAHHRGGARTARPPRPRRR